MRVDVACVVFGGHASCVVTLPHGLLYVLQVLSSSTGLGVRSLYISLSLSLALSRCIHAHGCAGLERGPTMRVDSFVFLVYTYIYIYIYLFCTCYVSCCLCFELVCTCVCENCQHVYIERERDGESKEMEP